MKFKAGDKVCLSTFVPGTYGIYNGKFNGVYSYIKFSNSEGNITVRTDALLPFHAEPTPVAHVHAELIKQWADNGSLVIQTRYKNTVGANWIDVLQPAWSIMCDYRIKPVPKPDVVGYFRASSPDGTCAGVNHAHHMGLTSYVSLNKAGSDNIKCVFDGETGKLKGVELV